MYSTELAAGDQAVMDAVRLPADVDGDPDVLNISIMLARTPTATEVITGEITGINVDDGTLDLLQDTMAWCVTTAGDTEIFQLFVDEDSVKAVPAELADLSTGSQALVSGTVNGCISADLIIADAPVAAPL